MIFFKKNFGLSRIVNNGSPLFRCYVNIGEWIIIHSPLFIRRIVEMGWGPSRTKKEKKLTYGGSQWCSLVAVERKNGGGCRRRSFFFSPLLLCVSSFFYFLFPFFSPLRPPPASLCLVLSLSNNGVGSAGGEPQLKQWFFFLS